MTFLNKEFIDNLPHSPASEIDKYQKYISKQIRDNTDTVGLNEARHQVNLKYGKLWRERLEIKKIHKTRK